MRWWGALTCLDLVAKPSPAPEARAAAAVIDRIVHHATGLTTNGDSYRLKAAQRNQTAHARQKNTR